MTLKSADIPQVVGSTPFIVVRGNNFLPVRTLLVLVCVIIGLGLTGCKSSQPVSSTTVTEQKKDSITTEKVVQKDSSSYIEQETKKIIPATTVESVYTKAQFDSLINGLKQLPTINRTIYKTDPHMQAMLGILIDSIGRVHIKCTSTEKTYFEKSITQNHYIERLANELTKVNEENKILKTENIELKKSWWQKLKDGFDNFLLKILLWIIAIGLGIALLDFGWSKIKKWFIGKIL